MNLNYSVSFYFYWNFLINVFLIENDDVKKFVSEFPRQYNSKYKIEMNQHALDRKQLMHEILCDWNI